MFYVALVLVLASSFLGLAMGATSEGQVPGYAEEWGVDSCVTTKKEMVECQGQNVTVSFKASDIPYQASIDGRTVRDTIELLRNHGTFEVGSMGASEMPILSVDREHEDGCGYQYLLGLLPGCWGKKSVTRKKSVTWMSAHAGDNTGISASFYLEQQEGGGQLLSCVNADDKYWL